MKRYLYLLIPLIALLAALVAAACFNLVSRLNPVPDTPAQSAYELPDYGITPYGREIKVAKSDLCHFFDNRCTTVPQLKDSPRFRYLLNRPGDTVTLTPRDMLMLFLYEGQQETVDDTIETYKEEIMIIIFELDEEGYVFRASTCSFVPTEEDIAKNYEEILY